MVTCLQKPDDATRHQTSCPSPDECPTPLKICLPGPQLPICMIGRTTCDNNKTKKQLQVGCPSQASNGKKVQGILRYRSAQEREHTKRIGRDARCRNFYAVECG